jgi:hypothetical protein
MIVQYLKKCKCIYLFRCFIKVNFENLVKMFFLRYFSEHLGGVWLFSDDDDDDMCTRPAF